MPLSCHTEVATLSSLFIKKAADAFVNDEQVSKEWKALNYLSKPDFEKAVTEYENFENILKQHCKEIYYLPFNASVTMDSIYCRDAAIATNKGMIICNMGKLARSNEPMAEQKAFIDNNISILGTITSPGTIEGGDVAWLDEHTLAVGRYLPHKY